MLGGGVQKWPVYPWVLIIHAWSQACLTVQPQTGRQETASGSRGRVAASHQLGKPPGLSPAQTNEWEVDQGGPIVPIVPTLAGYLVWTPTDPPPGAAAYCK